MAAKKPKPQVIDVMDGAVFPVWATEKDPLAGNTPADYMTNPETGLRPGQDKPPYGMALSKIDERISEHVTLPPRSIWKQGQWKSNSGGNMNEDFRTWVVPGDGTPGNYKVRQYICPRDIAADPNPPHPSDWKKKDFDKPPKQTSMYSTQQTKKTPTSSLPFGVRFQCPGCGHWYKESDLAGHAQICPATDGGQSLWAIECSCPCDNLDLTAKAKPGFPKKPPTKEAATDEVASP